MSAPEAQAMLIDIRQMKRPSYSPLNPILGVLREELGRLLNHTLLPRVVGQANHPAPDLLLGDVDMERTLETQGAIGVIRCIKRADSQHGVLPGHGRAFEPAIRNAACDRGSAC